MEEIDLKDLLLFYIKHLWILLIGLVLSLVLGVVYVTTIKKPMYRSETTLILVSEEAVTQNDIVLYKNLISTYNEIVKSKSVLNDVIFGLNLDCTYDELTKKISVTNISDTEIIRITVDNEDALLAKKIANKTANVFISKVEDIYNLENVSVIDKAMKSNEPYNISPLKDLVIFAAIGTFLMAGVLFVLYYFNNSVKSDKEVEKVLGVPVLGNIPVFKEGK